MYVFLMLHKKQLIDCRFFIYCLSQLCNRNTKKVKIGDLKTFSKAEY